VSVDTNTQGKNLSRYERHQLEGVDLLIPQRLARWAADLKVDVRRSVLGRRFVVEAGHAHGPG
jgi:hypothetical protein